MNEQPKGFLTPAEEFAITVGARVTLPSRPITDRKTPYTRSEHTNLKERFERIRAEREPF